MTREVIVFDSSKGEEFRMFCETCRSTTYHLVLCSVDQTISSDIEDNERLYKDAFWNKAIYQTIKCLGCKTIIYRSDKWNSEDQGDRELGIPDQHDIETYPKPYELCDFQILYNRRTLNSHIPEIVATTQTSQSSLALILIDLDRFKRINDSFGHLEGDQVLKGFFKIVKQVVGKKGSVYRYGGEEVAVLLQGYYSDEALTLAEIIRKAIEQSKVSTKVSITASFGVACLPAHASDDNSLAMNADTALYQAKRAGRNCVRVYNKSSKGRFGCLSLVLMIFLIVSLRYILPH